MFPEEVDDTADTTEGRSVEPPSFLDLPQQMLPEVTVDPGLTSDETVVAASQGKACGKLYFVEASWLGSSQPAAIWFDFRLITIDCHDGKVFSTVYATFLFLVDRYQNWVE